MKFDQIWYFAILLVPVIVTNESMRKLGNWVGTAISKIHPTGNAQGLAKAWLYIVGTIPSFCQGVAETVYKPANPQPAENQTVVTREAVESASERANRE